MLSTPGYKWLPAITYIYYMMYPPCAVVPLFTSAAAVLSSDHASILNRYRLTKCLLVVFGPTHHASSIISTYLCLSRKCGEQTWVWVGLCILIFLYYYYHQHWASSSVSTELLGYESITNPFLSKDNNNNYNVNIA